MAVDPQVPIAGTREELMIIKDLQTSVAATAANGVTKPSVLVTTTTLAQVIAMLAARGMLIDGN